MRNVLLVLTAFFSLIFNESPAQGFEPPTDSTAALYLTRVSTYGYAVSFDYFLEDQYIGSFKGRNYMRLELNEGNHRIWAISENRSILDVEVLAGQTYIVMVDVKTGYGKGQIVFRPIDKEATVDFKEAKELIYELAPVEISQKDVMKKNKKRRKFIENEVANFEQNKDKLNIKHIYPEMAIPTANLQK